MAKAKKRKTPADKSSPGKSASNSTSKSAGKGGKKSKKKAKAKKSKVYIAKSPIHGKGLFAAVKIPADTVLGTLKSKPAKKDGTYVLWLSQKKGIEIINEFKYINHSSKPNVALYDKEVITLKKIKADEELTHNYNG